MVVVGIPLVMVAMSSTTKQQAVFFFLSSFNGRCQRVNEENGFLV